jgi:hypothetical protein
MHEDFICYIFAAARFCAGRKYTGRGLCGRAAVKKSGGRFFYRRREKKENPTEYNNFYPRRRGVMGVRVPGRGIYFRKIFAVITWEQAGLL